MHRVRQGELQTLINQRRGFVVNMDTIKNVARYHNLEAPCWFTLHQLRDDSSYDTYFAETREDLEQRPYLWGDQELERCIKCYPQHHG